MLCSENRKEQKEDAVWLGLFPCVCLCQSVKVQKGIKGLIAQRNTDRTGVTNRCLVTGFFNCFTWLKVVRLGPDLKC